MAVTYLSSPGPAAQGGQPTASNVRRFRTGNYYTFWNQAADTTQITVVGTVIWTPFPVDAPAAFDTVGVDVTTGAASSTLACGIYSDSGYGKPDALLTTLSAGLDTSAVAQPTATLTPNIGLGVGLYWLAYVALVGTPTLRSVAALRCPWIGADVLTTQAPTHWALTAQGSLPASASSASVGSAGTLAKVMLKAV